MKEIFLHILKKNLNFKKRRGTENLRLTILTLLDSFFFLSFCHFNFENYYINSNKTKLYNFNNLHTKIQINHFNILIIHLTLICKRSSITIQLLIVRDQKGGLLWNWWQIYNYEGFPLLTLLLLKINKN